MGDYKFTGGRETLSDIMSDNTLVLRYSEMHCDVCIDSIVSKLNIYQDSIGLQNIVLFTSTKNMNYVKSLRGSITFILIFMALAMHWILY